MARPGSVSPSGGATVRTLSSARLALAAGLLTLGIGDLGVINLVLLPRFFAGDPGGQRPSPSHHERAVAATRAPAPPALVPVSPPAPPALAPPPPAPVTALPGEAATAPAPLVAAPPTSVEAPLPPADEERPRPAAAPAEGYADLLFARNTTWLSAPSRQTLDRVAETLKAAPNRRVLLSGHTDRVGPPELNRWLSLSRARRAASYLQTRGVSPVRIDIQSFGPTQPLATEPTPAAWARNRRVEIQIQ